MADSAEPIVSIFPMLITRYEWQLDVLKDKISGTLAGSWETGVLTFDTTPFLLHDGGNTLEDVPTSTVVPSIDTLIEDLQRRPSLDRVKVDVIVPMRGCQPVSELWAYESGEDNAVHYAYVSPDGTLEPCVSEQRRMMTKLKRKFVLNVVEGSGKSELLAQL